MLARRMRYVKYDPEIFHLFPFFIPLPLIGEKRTFLGIGSQRLQSELPHPITLHINFDQCVP
jgi:hypothetical protein